MLTHSRRRLAKIVLAAGLGGLLAGCGGGGNGVADLPPDQIVDRAKQAALAAPTARATGSVTQGGRKFSLDVTFVAGKGAKGSFSTGEQKFQFRKVNDAVYVKITRRFLQRIGAPSTAGLQGQYLNLSKTGQDLGPFETFGNKKKFFTEFFSGLDNPKKVDGTEIRGTPTVGLEQPGSGGSVGTLYVATEGKPYPLRVVSSGQSQGKVDFTEYGAPATLKAPPPSQVVSLQELRQLGSPSG